MNRNHINHRIRAQPVDPELIPETQPDPSPRGVARGRAVTCRKLRVEECHSLDLSVLRRSGALDPEQGGIWTSAQPLPRGGTSVVHYTLSFQESEPIGLVLFDGPPAPPTPQPVLLDSTPCHLGGRRFWFVCPLVSDGIPCRRRCRILYRPPGQAYFACRECHRLTYRTRQWHRDKWWEGFVRPLELLDEWCRQPLASLGPRAQLRRLRRLQRAVPAAARFPRLLEAEMHRRAGAHRKSTAA